MSRADEIKNKMKNKNKNDRNARNELMGAEEPMIEVNENVNINNDMDINAILNKSGNKKSDKELVGIYFEPKVKSALDLMQKREGRGAKSDFVNDIVKWALIQKGYRLD